MIITLNDEELKEIIINDLLNQGLRPKSRTDDAGCKVYDLVFCTGQGNVVSDLTVEVLMDEDNPIIR